MAIGVAIIGSGLFVRNEHLPAIGACGHLVLKAVYSRSLNSVQALLSDRKNVDLYSDDSGAERSYEALLSRADIHAVVIALPITIQPQYVRKALAASKHVLSEKPVASNLQEATELVDWYQRSFGGSKVSWGVAENFRFQNSYEFAAKQIAKLGRILTFRCRWQSLVKPGNQYYETSWRKTPSYQGGFLLDGGVHFIAILRQLLGSDNLVRVSGFTAQLQEHLPPVDTVEGAARSTSGALGSISLSAGTTAAATEYIVGCEGGTVWVSRETVKVTVDERETSHEIPNEKAGVAPEIRAWAEGIIAGELDARQRPQEALADLEVIESLLKSGEANGIPVDLKYQEISH